MTSAATKGAVEAAIGLGSNVGDRLAHLRSARARIAALAGTRLLGCSPVYETEPVDVPEADRDRLFLNAVLVCATRLPVEDWSRALHAIEEALRRVRTGVRHAPRTIDIDLLTYGDTISDRPHLRLPHAQCACRRFVCQPFADLRPDLVLPGRTETIAALLHALPPTPAVTLYAREW